MTHILKHVKTPKIRVDVAIKHAGSQVRLARMLGLHKASITMWKKRELVYVPDIHAFRLEKLYPHLVESASEARSHDHA